MVSTNPFSGSMPAMRPNDPRNPKPAVDPIQQFQQNYRRQIMQMNYPKEYAAAMEDQKAQEQRDRESQRRIGNPVGGVTTVGLLAGPGRELSSINTWGEFDMAPEPKASSPFAPGAGYQATDPSDPYYSKTPRKPMRLAEGGPVEGPGGPKDDLINAKLSDGEFVMPAEVVEFYGLDRLHKMLAKAKEGLNEIKPAPQALPTPLPVTMPQPTPAFAYGGMATRDPLPGFKLGGQFDEEERPTDAMDPLPQAIAAQQRAVEANQNPSFLDYYFPEAGVEASQAASSATQRATDSLGRFFEAEAAATAADRERMAETRQRQDAMMNYAPGSPAPRPAPSPLPEFLGRAAPLFPQGRPVSPSPATPMMAPAPAPAPSPQVPFVADPATLAAMRSRRADLRAGQPLLIAPEGLLAQGRAVLDALPTAQAPMDVPLMRPAPLTMTEKERQAMPISRSRTPESNPEFEAAMAGLTGLQKRRARQGLQMEEATNQRNQARAAIEQAQADERANQERALNFEEWKQKRVIDFQFDMAARNQAIGENAALGAATTREAREYEEAQNRRKQEEQSKKAKNFTPIPDTDYLINDLGNLISKKTNKSVGLSPEEAQKYGLVIIGADSDGRVRYGPAKVVEPTQDYIDPVSGDVLKLKPGQVLPEGTFFKPLQPNAAPAPTGQQDPAALRQKYGYGK